MTIVPPTPDEPRRPSGPRNPGDAWVVAETGERYWGRYGAAGLLAVDAERGILLQHRVSWSHFGGTWGLPGGALHEGESAIDGAVREAQEEAGIPDAAVRPRFTSLLDLDIWTYTTVAADVLTPFEPTISDPESVALEWVPIDSVAERPLHPGFAKAWPELRSLLQVRPAIVVDCANVVGAVPDGWWKDRSGATERLRDRLGKFAGRGLDADALGLSKGQWFPELHLVVEGEARNVAQSSDAVYVVPAPAAGDDEIVRQTAESIGDGRSVTVITSDRALGERVRALGASVSGAGWLLSKLDAIES